MTPQTSLSSIRSIFFVGVFLILLIVGASLVLPPEHAKTIPPLSQDNQTNTEPSQRELRTGTPKHIPLKIKAKNVINEKWANDLEIEVTNTSDKPIYFLSFSLRLQGIKAADGLEFGFWLHYGRPQLIDFSVPVESTDIPLLPNETCVLKIPEAEANGWETYRKKNNKPHPMKIGLVFQSLNFGDGTGFSDAQGTFINIHRPLAYSDEKCLSPPPKATSQRQQFAFLPAAFMPVNFLSISNSELLTKTTPQPDVCCDDGCERLKAIQYTCQRICDPNNPEKPSSATVGCTDPSGSCRKKEQYYVSCSYEGTPLSCFVTDLYACCTLCGSEGLTEATCHDNFDNDGDGYVDCAEPNCAFLATYGESNCDDGVNNDCQGGTDCGDQDCWDQCIDHQTGCTYNQIIQCNDVQGFCYGGSCYTPILIDVLGDGYQLTDALNGVEFDLGGGERVKIAWTSSNTDDAWLALDRNSNGQIDSGKELFGNFTEQPVSSEPQGFLALAVFDSSARGGNTDGRIDQRDAVFPLLRLWKDINHNGISEPSELHTLSALDVVAIDLDYKESPKRDEFGNRFRYRAKVYDSHGVKVGRWAWDVFLQMAP